MKLKFRRVAVALVAMLALTCALMLFAACNDSDNNSPAEVKVAFHYLGEGEDIELVGKAGDALAVPKVEDSEDFYFGGWFATQDFSGDAIGEDAKFPSADAEYYANWYVKYVFEASIENADGEFERYAEGDLEGKVNKGELDAVTVTDSNFALPRGYKLKAGSYMVQLSDRDNVRQVQFEKKTIIVTYESGIGGVSDHVESGKFGMAAAGDPFGTQQNRRFVGWAESEDGAVAYVEGDTLEFVENTTLYAVWATPYPDAFGGSDVIYAAKGKSDIAVLSKFGWDDIVGEIDLQSAMFSFADEGGATLTGKLLKSTFFYFKDSYFNVLRSEIDGRDDTLELKDGGVAVYTDERGASHTGSYTADDAGDEFEFVGDGLNFVFKLYEPMLGVGEMTFRIKDDMEGYYAEKNESGYGYNLLYFDGFGNATEIWDSRYPYYNSYLDFSAYIFEGEYELLEDDSMGMPQADVDIAMVPDYGIYASYRIRVDNSVSGSLNGLKLRGVYTLWDGYAGTYKCATAQDDRSQDLTLDGYEYATFRGEQRQYVAEVIHWYDFTNEQYTDEGSPEYEEHSHSYIRIKTDEGEMFVALNKSEYSMYNSYEIISAEKNAFVFENSTDFLYDGAGDLMLELWHEQAVVWQSHVDSNGLTFYTVLDEGVVTPLDDGWKQFAGDVKFAFLITDCSSDFTVRWRSVSNRLEFVKDELYIDADGVGRYVVNGTPTEVKYSVQKGLVEIYSFEINGGERKFAVKGTSVEEMTSATTLDEARSSEMVVARLVTLANSRAFVMFRLSDKVTYACLIDGTVSEIGGGEWHFEATDVEPGYETDLDSYMSFDFKPGVSDFVKSDGYKFSATDADGDVFEADGYGNARFARAGQPELEGEYEFLDSITVFVYDGGEIFLNVEGSGNERSFAIVGNEAGYYYELVAGNVSQTGSYFFLDGEGGVVYRSYDSQYGTFFVSEGTYASREKQDADGYDEYKFTFDDNDLYMPGQYIVHMGEEKDTLGRIVRTYWVENPAVDGTYIVEMNGELAAVLTVQKGAALLISGEERYIGSMLRCDVLDKEVTTAFTDGSRQISENPEGKSIFFSFGSGEDYFEFVFDITDKKQPGEDGVNYTVISARMFTYGMYGRYDGERRDEKIYLDGHGNMTVYDAAGGVADEGKVEIKEEGGYVLTFTGAKSSFDFVITLHVGTTNYEMSRFEYVVYDPASDRVFLGDDWETLVLDGFGGAELIDKYGVATEGSYTAVIDNVIKFESSWLDVKYIALEDGKFSVCADDFIYRHGVLYSYMGYETEIRIPGEVVTVAENAFLGTSVTKVDFVNVERVENYAFSGLALEEVRSEHITYVGEGAFSDMGVNLKLVYLPKATHIGDGAFYGDTAIDRIVLGDITSIGEAAFTLDESEGTVLLDLTRSQNIAGITIAQSAFVAVDADGEIPDAEVGTLRVLVDGVQTVNSLLQNPDAPAIIGKNAVISFGEEVTSLEASQTKFGSVAFYSVTDGSVYILDGKFSKILDIDACTVQSFALYECEIETKTVGGEDVEVVEISLYMLENGVYSTTPIKSQNGFLQFEGQLLMSVGPNDNRIVHSFEDADGKTLELATGIDYDIYDGWKLAADITYDGKQATSCEFSDEGITFVLEDAQYAANIEDGVRCSVEKIAQIKTLCTSGDGYRLGVAVREDGSLADCVSFEKRSANGYEMCSIVSVEAMADGTLQVIASTPGTLYNETFIVAYDPQTDTLSLVKNGITYRSDEESGNYFGLGLAWDIETGRAIKCTEFSIDDVNYEVKRFEVVSDNVVRVAIEREGTEETYEIRYSVEFGFVIVSVRKI